MANKNWEKIKDDFFGVLAGVIIGIPAIGIVIPKIFSIFSDQQGVEMALLFKIFSLAYFTMPLIILFILFFFQFRNDAVKKLRRLIWGIIGLIVGVFICMLLFGRKHVVVALPLIVLASFAYYWFNFRDIIQGLSKEIDEYKSDINRRELELNPSPEPQDPSSPDQQTPGSGALISGPGTPQGPITFGDESASPLAPQSQSNLAAVAKRTRDLDDLEIVKNKLNEAYASIKLSVFYFFVASQLAVVVLLTVFNKLYDSVWYCGFMILPYLIVVLHYTLNEDLKNLKKDSQVSNLFFRVILITAVAAIGVVFVMSKSKGVNAGLHNGWLKGLASPSQIDSTYNSNFSLLDTARRIHEKINAVDIANQAIEKKKTAMKIAMAPLNYFTALIKDTTTNKDSVDLFVVRVNSIYNVFYPDKIKAKFTPVELSLGSECFMKFNALKDYLEKSDTVKAAQIGALKAKGKQTKATQKNSKKQSVTITTVDSAGVKRIIGNLKKAILTDTGYKKTMQKYKDTLINWQVMQFTLQQSRNSLVKQDGVYNYQIRQQQLTVVKDTQHTGIVIFVTTLIVLISFLLILNYKDDQYQPETLPEIEPIKKILQAVCIIIGILLLPLVKMVPDDQIDPEKPSDIFLVDNWNLAKWGSTDADNKEVKPLKKVHPVPPVSQVGSGCDCDGSSRIKMDTLIVKIMAGSNDSLKTALTNLISTLTLNAANTNNYFSSVDQMLKKLSVKPVDVVAPEINLDKLLERLDTTNLKLGYIGENISSLKERVIQKIGEVKAAVDQAQYKTPASKRP